MAISLETPIKPFTRATPTQRRRMLAAAKRADERALFRFTVAKTAALTPGTLEQKRQAVALVLKVGPVHGRVPCPESIRKLDRMYRLENKVSVEDYRFEDGVTYGRARLDIPLEARAIVRRTAMELGFGNKTQLVKVINKRVTARGLLPLSKYHVGTVLSEIGAAAVSAGRHGAHAAEMDTAPRLTYPTMRPNDQWNFDETEDPLFECAYCRVTRQLVSAEPTLLLNRDHFSGAVIGWHLSEPTRRIDKDNNRSFRSGFDADDVLATLLVSACPEIAPRSTRELAGGFPQRLRWDNAAQHEGLTNTLREWRLELTTSAVHPDLPDFDDIVSNSPVRRPDHNGPAERLMSTIKGFLLGEEGHRDERTPADALSDMRLASPGRVRSEVTSKGPGRETRKAVVPPDALPRREELLAAIDRAVYEYNYETVLRRHGMTPAAAYLLHRGRPTPPGVVQRRGVDFIRMLPLDTALVRREGIVLTRDGRDYAFAAIANGLFLAPGSVARFREDPAHRAIWIEQGKDLITLQPVHQVASGVSAADVAASRAAVARRLSDEAQENLVARIDAAYGAGTAARGEDARKAAADAAKRAARTDDSVPRTQNAAEGAAVPFVMGAEAGSKFELSVEEDY